MKNPVFTGSSVAIVTPMHADGSVNFEKLGDLIEFQIAGGTDAITICGTTGESATLKDDEHLAAIKYTVEQVAGRIPVIAGTGSNDTAHAIEMSQGSFQLRRRCVIARNPLLQQKYTQGTDSALYKNR